MQREGGYFSYFTEKKMEVKASTRRAEQVNARTNSETQSTLVPSSSSITLTSPAHSSCLIVLMTQSHAQLSTFPRNLLGCVFFKRFWLCREESIFRIKTTI